MWISRETWPRASRSSKAGRIAAGAVLLLLSAAASLPAQEARHRAVLLRGPEQVRGIPLLPLNTLPAWRGWYELDGRRLAVYCTRPAVPLPGGLAAVPCAGLAGVRRLPPPARPPDEAEPGALVYAGPPGYGLFVEAGPAGDPRGCAFLKAFVERFEMLLSYVQGETEVPFPAVVDLAP